MKTSLLSHKEEGTDTVPCGEAAVPRMGTFVLFLRQGAVHDGLVPRAQAEQKVAQMTCQPWNSRERVHGITGGVISNTAWVPWGPWLAEGAAHTWPMG